MLPDVRAFRALGRSPFEGGWAEVMDNVLRHPFFGIVGIPVLLMLVGVCAKKLARRDGDTSPHRNDWAVSTTTLLAMLGSATASLHQPASTSGVVDTLGWLILILAVLFTSITYDRYASWVRDAHGAPTESKAWVGGILLPDACALSFFVIYQLQKAS